MSILKLRKLGNPFNTTLTINADRVKSKRVCVVGMSTVPIAVLLMFTSLNLINFDKSMCALSIRIPLKTNDVTLFVFMVNIEGLNGAVNSLGVDTVNIFNLFPSTSNLLLVESVPRFP